jgi:hypothetical protein
MGIITASLHQQKKNSKEAIGFTISDEVVGKSTDEENFWWLMANFFQWHISSFCRTGKAFDLSRHVDIELFDGRKKNLFVTRTKNQMLLSVPYEGKLYTIKNDDTGTHLSNVPPSNLERVLNYVTYSVAYKNSVFSPTIPSSIETNKRKH